MLIDLKELIDKYNLIIKGIVHIGAHAVEEYDIYKNCSINNVVWFEADPKQFNICQERLRGTNQEVYNHVLYNKTGEKLRFNLSNNTQCSSILKLKKHSLYYPEIIMYEFIELSTIRLDDAFITNSINSDSFNFVNLDIQGAELYAIKGFGDFINKVDYIYTEVNRAELYEGCYTIDQMDKYLRDYGFERVETVWTHAEWGDAFYIKSPKLKIVVTSFNNEDWVQTNIESILEQTYKNYEVLYIDDCSQDNTYEIIDSLVKDNKKFTVIKHNENKSKAYSFMTYIKDFVKDDDIILFIDGDDWIAYNDIFEKVVYYYIKNNVWTAYSKMICYPSLQESPVHGKDHPEDIHKFNLYRQYPFIASHLKTMKGFLFKNINENDLKYENEWIRFGDDVAIMCAAMEQSPKEKIGVMNFISYVYNESETNKNRSQKDYNNGLMGEKYIRSIKPYSTIRDNSKKYISPRILGRLGNQLFEIATAYSLALDNKCSIKISTKNGVFTSQLGEVGSPYNYKENVFRNIKFSDDIGNFDIWKEPSFSYTPISYKFDKNLYIEGQFQSEKYFIHNRDKIIQLFKYDKNIENYIVSKYKQILLGNTVSLHVRRGDYLLTPDYHPTCGLDYYNKAIQLLPKIDSVLVFSDDCEWAKKSFTEEKYIIIEGEKDYIDLYLMTMCKNNIIANSSFSWWGAWLNENPDKIVIAPKNWFGSSLSNHDTKDLIPETWIKI